ncbi:hypothetical protein POF50_023410 [Streptomyces sp. SL13]|jgi:hypothetical protein|uniref:Uncharacterized protein n=1 Tax=Streptantibioticus silvisoli TaxID=2705255 RepID=A0AA90HC81_9ACTN|nr:hypothetical protein [Streptantibioticus silvisoli]MDI5972247.1 hypothetical protein [Streptantibioticus silvisoli]
MTETQEQDAAGSAPGTVNGYRIVVPNEWQKIPVRRGTDKAIKNILDRAFAHFGRDEVAQWRRELEARLKKVVKEARSNAGVDMYIPLGQRERNLPASFMISFVEFGSGNAPRKEDVLSEVGTSTSGAVPVTIDGTTGLRTMRDHPADPKRGTDYASRRIEYVLPVPGSVDSWLVASFSTFGGSRPDDHLARLLSGLFDAIMGTFRWQYQEETA